MTKIVVDYEGDLRTKCTHFSSKNQLITDAPIDNKGKGESFSPTDLLATAYLSCMLTIVGVYCSQNEIEFLGASGSVEKEMKSNPRRIGELKITIDFSKNKWSDKEKNKIEKAAKSCPVAKSISSEIEIDITFNYA